MASPNTLKDLYRLELQSSCGTFPEIETTAREIQLKYNHPVIGKYGSEVSKVNMPIYLVDKTAQSLLNPQDIISLGGKRLIKTMPDGNCLFNAMSRAVCGKEYMANELRLCTALELTLNPEYYGAHPITKELKLTTHSGKEWPLNGLYDAVVFSNDDPHVQHTRALGLAANRTDTTLNFQRAVEKEICGTFRNYAWSGLMQIMGLASAVGCNIQLLYPDKRHSLFPMLNGNRKKELQVNHFVPCLQVPDKNTEDRDWITVSKTRKRTATVPMVNTNEDEINADSSTETTSTSTFDGSHGSLPGLTLKDFLIPTCKKASRNAKTRRKNSWKSSSVSNHKLVQGRKDCEGKNSVLASKSFPNSFPTNPKRDNSNTNRSSSDLQSSGTKRGAEQLSIGNLNDVLMSNTYRPSATPPNEKRQSYNLPYLQLSRTWYESNCNSFRKKRKSEMTTIDGRKKQNEDKVYKRIPFQSLSKKWYALQALTHKLHFGHFVKKVV